MLRKTVITLAVIAILVGTLYSLLSWYYRSLYPMGMYHRCDKQLYFALMEYAQEHGGEFPSGQATPEASLSLIGAKCAYLLRRRDVPEEDVQQILENGDLLSPETCGWNYVEGLRLDSNPELALFWDKEGLSEVGSQLPDGGHMVTFINSPYVYISASRWDGFLNEQRRLLTKEREKTDQRKTPSGRSVPSR